MNAEELARALGFKKSGGQYVGPCVAHDDRNPSMIIFDGHTGVQVRCLAGCDQRDLIAVLKSRGLWNGGDRRLSGPRALRHREPVRSSPSANVPDEAWEGSNAARIWSEAESIGSTDGEQYFADRQRPLTLPHTLHCRVRYHPRCPRRDERVPAVVVLMQAHDTSRPRAIQRIFIKRDGDRVVKDGKPMMMGPAGGAAMKLTSHCDTFWDVLSYCPVLYVCEGFETGLGLLQHGVYPLWALGSTSAIGSFPTIFGVGEIVVCADHDSPGLKAAEACHRHWAEAGRRARIFHPEGPGKDYADE